MVEESLVVAKKLCTVQAVVNGKLSLIRYKRGLYLGKVFDEHDYFLLKKLR